jgi:hypothetical protein
MIWLFTCICEDGNAQSNISQATMRPSKKITVFFLTLFVVTAWFIGLAYVLMEMDNDPVCEDSFHPPIKDCRGHLATLWSLK